MIRRFVPEVEPNEGFMMQLAEYDLELLQRNEWGFYGLTINKSIYIKL